MHNQIYVGHKGKLYRSCLSQDLEKYDDTIKPVYLGLTTLLKKAFCGLIFAPSPLLPDFLHFLKR